MALLRVECSQGGRVQFCRKDLGAHLPVFAQGLFTPCVGDASNFLTNILVFSLICRPTSNKIFDRYHFITIYFPYGSVLTMVGVQCSEFSFYFLTERDMKSVLVTLVSWVDTLLG